MARPARWIASEDPEDPVVAVPMAFSSFCTPPQVRQDTHASFRDGQQGRVLVVVGQVLGDVVDHELLAPVLDVRVDERSQVQVSMLYTVSAGAPSCGIWYRGTSCWEA